MDLREAFWSQLPLRNPLLNVQSSCIVLRLPSLWWNLVVVTSRAWSVAGIFAYQQICSHDGLNPLTMRPWPRCDFQCMYATPKPRNFVSIRAEVEQSIAAQYPRGSAVRTQHVEDAVIACSSNQSSPTIDYSDREIQLVCSDSPESTVATQWYAPRTGGKIESGELNRVDGSLLPCYCDFKGELSAG